MIKTMPTYLGEQLYISGFPLPAKDVHYQGISIQDRFIRKGIGTHNLKEDEDLCRDYMLYYLLSPCWAISEKTKALAMKADYDELWDICLENGIDPF